MAFGLSCVPFREELRILRHITAAKEDPVVSTALNFLEAADIPHVGVEPHLELVHDLCRPSCIERC